MQVLHAEFGPVLPGIPQCPSLRDFVVVCQQGGYGPGDKGKFIISSPSWKQLIRAMPTPKACVPAAGVSFHDCFTDARRCIKEYSPAALPRELPLVRHSVPPPLSLFLCLSPDLLALQSVPTGPSPHLYPRCVVAGCRNSCNSWCVPSFKSGISIGPATRCAS